MKPNTKPTADSELRPLEAQELDIVNGAAVHFNMPTAGNGGPSFLVQDFLNAYDRAPVTSPLGVLSDGGYATRSHVFPS
jgi:hypothetical protein